MGFSFGAGPLLPRIVSESRNDYRLALVLRASL